MHFPAAHNPKTPGRPANITDIFNPRQRLRAVQIGHQQLVRSGKRQRGINAGKRIVGLRVPVGIEKSRARYRAQRSKPSLNCGVAAAAGASQTSADPADHLPMQYPATAAVIADITR